MFTIGTRRVVAVVATIVMSSSLTQAQVITESNYDALVPAGKEVDAIYGDIALENKFASAVIAQPISSRNANMTVRDVGGCVIDFTDATHESDQLGAFYPGRKMFPFSKFSVGDNFVSVASAENDSRPRCEVRYQLHASQPILEITTTWTNTTADNWPVSLTDEMRIDGGNEDMRRSLNGDHDLVYVNDVYWQQAYGVRAAGYRIRSEDNGRLCVLTYEPVDGKSVELKPGESFEFKRELIVARNLADVYSIADATSGIKDYPYTIRVVDSNDKVIGDAKLQINRDGQLRGIVQTDANGQVMVNLPAGEFEINAHVAGLDILPGKNTIDVSPDKKSEARLVADKYSPGILKTRITDDNGQAIPAKVEFIGSHETPTPNWGPDSAEHFVRNLAYTEDGEFDVNLQSGEYNLIVSHGPEFDALFTRVKIEPGTTSELNAALKHAVQTPGWVSSDFHSHSSPSGDNTASQLGRVLNLAAEQIEFAPCTEHNRISTYSEHLAALGLEPFMGTVSGMELTGKPLPLNHQNVFPLKRVPRTQDGGGPLTDADPEMQIERATLWDDRSEKLVQQNHPDIGWLFFDKNGDGSPDGGFRSSFRLMDVVEVHPIDPILSLTPFQITDGRASGNMPLFNWLQLLNQGYRIYGVVNTDAHYNFHGSGWLRNWIQSSTDDPAKIDPLDIVHAAEQGRLVMSNGPFLEASFLANGSDQSVVSGQDLVSQDGKISVHVRVQCPNWFDIDRVFLLINGNVDDNFMFSRASNPDMFADGVVKFDQSLELNLKQDSHIIVVTGNRQQKLGDVMGPSAGDQYPAALSNPVFVDVGGDGFVPNKDTLGQPLPVKFGARK